MRVYPKRSDQTTEGCSYKVVRAAAVALKVTRTQQPRRSNLRCKVGPLNVVGRAGL